MEAIFVKRGEQTDIIPTAAIEALTLWKNSDGSFEYFVKNGLGKYEITESAYRELGNKITSLCF